MSDDYGRSQQRSMPRAFAVFGGNAVAVWVAKGDPAATRTTKDVDLLVNKGDIDRITEVLNSLGFEKHDLCRIVHFVDPKEPSRQSGVHLVWAGAKVRPSYVHAAPSLDEAVLDEEGFWVLDLPALARMKLTSFRNLDKAHVEDLLRDSMIDERVRTSLASDLLMRLEELESGLDEE